MIPGKKLCPKCRIAVSKHFEASERVSDSSSSSSLMHSPAHSSSEEFADVSMEIEFLKESLQIIGETPVKTQKLSQKRYPQPGPKLGNAVPPPPPRNHLLGPPKNFFLDGDAKERASKGRCQARGVWGHASSPPEKFAEFHLILEAFCAF